MEIKNKLTVSRGEGWVTKERRFRVKSRNLYKGLMGVDKVGGGGLKVGGGDGEGRGE